MHYYIMQYHTSCQTWNATQTQMNKINFVYIGMLRILVWNSSKTEDFKHVITNEFIIEIFTQVCVFLWINYVDTSNINNKYTLSEFY